MVTTRIEREPAPRKGNGKTRYTIDDAHQEFSKFFGKEFDMDTADATLAVAAAEKLAGDAPWLMIISGSGNAKTETVNSVSGVDHTIAISTIASEAALLSAVKPKKPGATGGILRRLGNRGVLIIKDFTSIISGDRKARTQILAALREVHDGKWNRSVGADGGQTISWEGRIVLVCACTTAWDTAYSVVAQMGPRFITIRSSARDGREAAGERSITNTGFESTIRSKITKIVTALINDAQLDEDEAELKKDERKKLVAAADLVTLARTGVEVDFQGNVIDAHEPEMPTRFVKQLVLIFRGALSIGIERKSALALALRCARDSIPPIRLLVLKDLDDENNTLEDCRVTDIAKRLYKPWTTIKRTLEALYVLRLVNRVEVEAKDDGNDDKADYAADDRSERKHTKKAKPKIMHYVLATNIKLTALDPGP